MDQIVKVLVIDDSPMVFKAVKKALEPEGFQMIGQAFNGQEGLDMVNQLKPDIVVLDITMPIMDGIQTAECLFQKNPASKVIILSAMLVTMLPLLASDSSGSGNVVSYYSIRSQGQDLVRETIGWEKLTNLCDMEDSY